MNDPIKDFVEQHREEFDHLNAPLFKLNQLKANIQRVPELRKSSLPIYRGNKWLVAASILIALSCAWFFFHSSDKERPLVQVVQQNTPTPEGENGQPKRTLKSNLKIHGHQQQMRRKANHSEWKATEVNTLPADLYARLKDSTSASARLLAILDLEKADQIDHHVLDMLAATLDHDGNTNVRLAALNLMEKYSYDNHVSTLLVRSLDIQNDPIVQLGLVSLLGRMKNIEIEDKLESLAYSPNTFAAVKDEAYSILLNQNKL